MPSASNKVLSGDYEGKSCRYTMGDVVIEVENGYEIILDRNTVESYQVLDAETTKSGTSTILRAGAGALLLGPIGLLAGVSGKRKGIYLIAVIFRSGKKSLIEVDSNIYKAFIQNVF